MSNAARRMEMASYAGACLSLRLQAIMHGVELGNVDATLCEDGRTVVLSAHDLEIRACFDLAEQTNEADFDPTPYVEGFNKQEDDD